MSNLKNDIIRKQHNNTCDIMRCENFEVMAKHPNFKVKHAVENS